VVEVGALQVGLVTGLLHLAQVGLGGVEFAAQAAELLAAAADLRLQPVPRLGRLLDGGREVVEGRAAHRGERAAAGDAGPAGLAAPGRLDQRGLDLVGLASQVGRLDLEVTDLLGDAFERDPDLELAFAGGLDPGVEAIGLGIRPEVVGCVLRR
jgi:hypothetical protein